MSNVDPQIFIASTKGIVNKAQWLSIEGTNGEGLRLGRIIFAVVYSGVDEWRVHYRVPGIRNPTNPFYDKEKAKLHAIRGIHAWFTWLLEDIPETASKDVT